MSPRAELVKRVWLAAHLAYEHRAEVWAQGFGAQYTHPDTVAVRFSWGRWWVRATFQFNPAEGLRCFDVEVREYTTGPHGGWAVCEGITADRGNGRLARSLRCTWARDREMTRSAARRWWAAFRPVASGGPAPTEDEGMAPPAPHTCNSSPAE